MCPQQWRAHDFNSKVEGRFSNPLTEYSQGHEPLEVSNANERFIKDREALRWWWGGGGSGHEIDNILEGSLTSSPMSKCE